MKVRAKVTHTEPGTQIYRTEGEVFEHQGDLYKHVEAVKGKPDDDEDEEKAPPAKRSK